MAQDRLAPCIHYICHGKCKMEREADQKHYCQKCGKYSPRIGYKPPVNKKKQAKYNNYPE